MKHVIERVAAQRIRGHPPAVIAGFSGWLLDAFDVFLATFCLTAMARDLNKTDVQIALVITLTMALRPVGGFVFGFLADRYGRRIPLMINIAAFVVAEMEALFLNRSARWICFWVLNESNATHCPEKRVEKLPIG